MKELKRLEATDLHIAFIKGDFESVQNLTSNNIEIKIYNLANKLRFMKFAMNQDNFKYNLTLKINEKDIPLHSLFNNIFTEITSMDKNNLAFIIQDDGGKTWNYNSCDYEYNNLRPLFDQLITYVTGSKYLFSEQISKTLVEFLSNYDGSTPHISGNYKGEFIQYMPVKDFHEQLISNNLEAPILETNINDDIIGLGGTIFDHVELYS